MRFKDENNYPAPLRVEAPDRIRAMESKTCNVCGGSGLHKSIEKQENGQKIERTRQCRNCKGTGKIT